MRKTIITLATFVIVAVCVFGAAVLSSSDVALPQAIMEDSACPVVGCASGSCHGFEAVPQPDGVHEMRCPEASCDSLECHAWDTLVGRYHQASDASMNLWILAPVVLVVGLVLIVRKVG